MRSLISVTVLALTLTACGGDDSQSEDAVEDAAQEQADMFSAGDFGGAYDMWTDESKELFSRDDYIEVNEACQNGGIPLEVADVRIEDSGEAVVRIRLGEFTQAYTMEFEDDEWRWVPSDESKAGYERGVEALVAEC